MAGLTVTLTVAGACVEVDPLAGAADSQVPPSAVLADAWNGVGIELLISTRTGWAGRGAGARDKEQSRRIRLGIRRGVRAGYIDHRRPVLRAVQCARIGNPDER